MVPGNANSKKVARRPLPFERLGDYRLTRCLGEGGMGEVYEAWDAVLGRRVAIKLLRGEDPAHVERFMREARSQAAVDHDRICKIFEVGETGGRPYIVMQFIDGQGLAEAAEEMTLDMKLRTIRRVAEAVHEANRAGLVHRDLKPANILVAETEEDGLKPYVLDFGLVQAAGAEQLTVTGDVLGTPGYMAPEQALGKTELDRRTDVYGLGATLYRLLCGHPPFTGSSPGKVMLDILEKDVPRLRVLAPSLPRDVETMVMKCLERHPERRYPSARALAEDLGRYLDGKPILARPSGWFYRLGKKIGRHRVVFGVATAALVLLLLSLVWGSWRAAARAELARELTARVKEIEAMARQAHLSRRHPIQPTYRDLRRRMNRIEVEMGHRSPGPVHFALGWGYLVLSQPERARHHLDRAWHAGYREPGAAYALGLAYSTLYRKKLQAAQITGDREIRARQEEEARLAFRDPALFYMNRALGYEEAGAEYLAALIAFCEGRYRQALPHLKEAQDHQPWRYEAHRLQADAYRQWALAEANAGEMDRARAFFSRAWEAYGQAIAIGESDPENYRTATHAVLAMMTVGMYASDDFFDKLKDGLALLEQRKEIVEDDGETLLLEAMLWRLAAQRLSTEGFDPNDELAAGVVAVQRALVNGADPSRANMEKGALFWQWSQWLNGRSMPSEHLVEEAIRSLETVTPLDRGYFYWFVLGSAYRNLGQARLKRGLASRLENECALEAFRDAVRLLPDRIEARNSIALCLYHLSSEKDLAAEPLLREAVEHLQKAIAINPNHVVLRFQLARTLLRLAQSGEPGGGSLQTEGVQAAIEQLETGLTLNPGLANLYSLLGWAWLLRAQHAWEHGLSPGAFFEKGIAACLAGLERAPNTRSLCHHLATLFYFRGKYRVRDGAGPGKDFENARVWAEKAMATAPDSEPLLILGSIARLEAEYLLRLENDPGEKLDRARQAFDSILQGNPNHAEAHRSLGRLFTLEAQWRQRLGKDPMPALQRARYSLDRALREAAGSPYFLIADARWFIQYAAVAPLDEGLSQKLGALAEALKTYDALPEAVAARACLSGLISPTGNGDDPSRNLVRAVTANPHLRYEWMEKLQ